MKDQTEHPEKHIDKALEDTFPASDPPSTSGSKTREERERRDANEKKDSTLKRL